MRLKTLIYLIKKKPRKVSYAERHGLYRLDYGVISYEEARDEDEEE